MSLNVFDEARKIWNRIPKDEKVKDLKFDINVHKKLLGIFQPGSFYYYIINVRQGMFELVSPEIEQVLGYPLDIIDLPFIINKMHPEDLPYFLNFEAAIEKFFSKITGESIFRYKVQYDYRIKKADGTYARMLNQWVVIQHDPEHVRTFVITTEITHLKKDNKPELSFIGLEGEPSYYNVDVKNFFRPVKRLFTKREQQILKSLTLGMSSNEISEALSISRFTVDSHRKNILKKAEAKSTAEVIKMAYDNGWI